MGRHLQHRRDREDLQMRLGLTAAWLVTAAALTFAQQGPQIERQQALVKSLVDANIREQKELRVEQYAQLLTELKQGRLLSPTRQQEILRESACTTAALLRVPLLQRPCHAPRLSSQPAAAITPFLLTPFGRTRNSRRSFDSEPRQTPTKDMIRPTTRPRGRLGQRHRADLQPEVAVPPRLRRPQVVALLRFRIEGAAQI